MYSVYIMRKFVSWKSHRNFPDKFAPRHGKLENRPFRETLQGSNEAFLTPIFTDNVSKYIIISPVELIQNRELIRGTKKLPKL